MAWVKWSHVMASLDKGGLGVGSLKAFNLALLQKWRWRLVNNPDVLWACVIKAIHGVDAGIDGKGCKSKGMWEKIMGLYSQLHVRNVIPISTLLHKVGCGSSIRQRFGSRNEEALLSMVAKIRNVSLSNQPDSWHWNINLDGIFLVNATRNHIDDCLLPSLCPSSRWSKFLPRKRFLLLHALLALREWNLSDHIFFGCDTAIGIWRLIRVWIDVSMPSFSSCSEWFQWIEDWRATKDSKDRMYVITASTLWMLWRYRNSVTFNSHPMRKCDIFDNIRLCSFFGLKLEVVMFIVGILG
nr:reverse transcriptase domain, reverse transcriptase zinc-binding domain protein [Tanacetum cinerariifolium]